MCFATIPFSAAYVKKRIEVAGDFRNIYEQSNKNIHHKYYIILAKPATHSNFATVNGQVSGRLASTYLNSVKYSNLDFNHEFSPKNLKGERNTS